MSKQKEPSESPPILSASSPEGMENELIAMAYKLAAERLANGTASAAETVHFLRMGSAKERLEQKLIEKDLELKQAKTEALQSAQRIEALYADAMSAFKSYWPDANDES